MARHVFTNYQFRSEVLKINISSPNSSSNITNKPTTSNQSNNTNTNTNTNTSVNSNYETRLTQVEETISSLQNSILNINTSPTTNVDNKIRVFPEALPFDEHNVFFTNDSLSELNKLSLFNNYSDNILEHLFLINPYGTTGSIKVKNSKYEKYFIISNNNIEINANIITETELNITAPNYFLEVWIDIPSGDDNNHLLFNNYLLFTGKTGKKHTIIDNIDFDINYNSKYPNNIYEIKITFPESVNIINNIPLENISTKQGSIITLKYDDKDLPLKDNNLDGEDSYTLVAQGSSKRYEIVFYWTKDTIPEFV